MPQRFAFPENTRLWVTLAPYGENDAAERAQPAGVRADEAGRHEEQAAPI